ncbi:MAG: cytochrome c [Acidobacteria bacterium]|nr:cytochrome c [Acidobacteriota bacterium]
MAPLRSFGAAALVLLGTGGAAPAQQAAAPSAPAAYTVEQAARGGGLYEEQCVSCHGPIRAFVPEMAALLGDHTFRSNWRGRPLGDLFGMIIETMPQDAPGTLSPEETAGIVAYILQGNRVPAGETELPHDPAVLAAIPFDP